MTSTPNPSLDIVLSPASRLDPREWNDLLSASEASTPFHARWWQLLYDDARIPARSFAILARSPSGSLLAAMPLTRFRLLPVSAFVSSGFSVYGHPLVRPDAPPDVLPQLLAAYARLASGPLAVLSRVVDLAGICAPLARSGYHASPTLTHVVPLSPRFDQVQKNFTSSAQNALHQARKSDLLVEPSRDPADMAVFARLSTANYRSHGRRPYPRSVYPALLRRLSADQLWFDVIRRGGRVVAGSVHVVGPRRVVYWMTACDRRFRRLRINDLLIAAAIERACLAGKRSYDLGPCPPEAEGLRAFKRKWGALDVPYTVYERSRLPWRIARAFLY